MRFSPDPPHLFFLVCDARCWFGPAARRGLSEDLLFLIPGVTVTSPGGAAFRQALPQDFPPSFFLEEFSLAFFVPPVGSAADLPLMVL